MWTKLPAAGYGSTSNSYAIVRTHYSTWAGVALAWEGFHYWKQWEEYLGVTDERGLARFVQCGGIFLGNSDRYEKKVLPLFEEFGIPYEIWTPAELTARLPRIDLGSYSPPKRPEDDAFWADSTSRVSSVVYTPIAGYVTDPQLSAHNLQRAAEARDAEFRFNTEVVGIHQSQGQGSGVSLSGGIRIEAPVVVNVAGPHSFLVNRMAGVAESMTIRTRALRHEVHHVPAPEGVDFERDGAFIGDDDLGIYTSAPKWATTS